MTPLPSPKVSPSAQVAAPQAEAADGPQTERSPFAPRMADAASGPSFSNRQEAVTWSGLPEGSDQPSSRGKVCGQTGLMQLDS